MIRKHIFILGNVQGVFFRKFVTDNAIKLKVTGWVKNIDSGVEAVFEGEDENVKELISLCENGPGEAKVEKVEIKNEDYKSEFDDFRVRY